MLDAAGEQLGALDRHRVAVDVEAGRDRAGGTGGGELQAGDGQAAFVVFFRLALELQYGVDQVAWLVVVHVVGEDAQADADLRGGEPGPWRVKHGLGEVPDQVAQLKVEVHHRLRRGPEHWIPEQPDIPEQVMFPSRRRVPWLPRAACPQKASACLPSILSAIQICTV